MRFLTGWGIGAGSMWLFIEMKPPVLIVGFILFVTLLAAYTIADD